MLNGPATANGYGDATIEDLAARWASIELILPGTWPERDCNALVDIQANLRAEILRRAAVEDGVLARYIRAREAYDA